MSDPRTIIGITGYARVGKDTVAEHLRSAHGFNRFAFADALRNVVAALDPMLCFEPKEYREGTAVTTVPLSQYIAEGRDDDWLKQHTDYREYLKRMGNGIRDIVGASVWVDIVTEKVAASHGNAVISDVRFPNEADRIHSWGGRIWRIVRDGYGPESEFELASDEIEADYTFGAPDVQGLQNVVDTLLQEFS